MATEIRASDVNSMMGPRPLVWALLIASAWAPHVSLAQSGSQIPITPIPAANQVGQPVQLGSDRILEPGESAVSYGVRGSAVLSSNLDLRPDGSDTGHSFFEAAPYVNYRSLTTRGPVSASASLRAQFRDGEFDAFRVRGVFAGATDLRLSQEWLYFRARGSVQTVNIDPFKASSTDPAAQAGNTGSLKDFEVSPYLRGKLGGDGAWNAAYLLRYIDLTNVNTLNSFYSGTNTQQTAEAGLRTDLSRNRLAMSVDSRFVRADYRNGLSYERAEADLLAWLKPREDLRLAAGVGWAYSDRLRNQAGNDRGTGVVAALEWTPTPRTMIRARWADRYYGNQISASADHRYSWWTFGVAYGRSVEDGNIANLYSLLQQQIVSARGSIGQSGLTGNVAGLENSPAAAAAATQNQALLFAGVLPSPLVYSEQASATVRLQGARASIQAAVFLNNRSSISGLVGLAPIDLNQQGLSLAGSYRLDGAQTLNLGLRYTLTDSSVNSSEARLLSAIASWDRRLSPRWTVSLGTRLQRQTGTGITVQFDEAALFMATDYRFQ